MDYSHLPKNLDFPNDLVINISPPQHIPNSDESLEFHAARLILLLNYAGGRLKRIIGRTKLVKLDFFVRYPTYLKKITESPQVSDYLPPESPMIRYKYGPWDNKYYDIFALLVAKGLITITPSAKGDQFQLTEKGVFAASELDTPEFQEIIERCNLVYDKFKQMSGTQIKEFIYSNFPEIVHQPVGTEIE
jgi:hypothetical protein